MQSDFMARASRVLAVCLASLLPAGAAGAQGGNASDASLGSTFASELPALQDRGRSGVVGAAELAQLQEQKVKRKKLVRLLDAEGLSFSNFLPDLDTTSQAAELVDQGEVEQRAGEKWFRLRLRRDIRAPGNLSQPARASWKKSGAGQTLDLNGQLGFAIGLSDWKRDFGFAHELLVYAGNQRRRFSDGATGTDIDRREYYLGWTGLLQGGFAWITENKFVVGVQRDEDQRSNLTRNLLSAEWFPGIDASWFWTEFTDAKDVKYVFSPSLSLELADYERNDPGVVEVDAALGTRLDVGLEYERVRWQTKASFMTDLGEIDRSVGSQESTLSIKFGSKLSILLSYDSGRTLMDRKSDETVEIGLGVTF